MNEWMTLGWEGWWTMLLFLLFFSFLVWERFPADVVAIVAAGAMVMTGVISPNDFVTSFTKEIIVILAMLFTIARSLELGGVLSLFAAFALPKRGGARRGLTLMLTPIAALSAFLNNTPIVLMMVPVVRKWSSAQGHTLSKFLIPLSYAAILGGACTLIGTSTNLVVSGLLRQADRAVSLSFFEFSWVAFPCALIGLLYLIFFGPKVVAARADPASTLAKESRDFTGEFIVQESSPLVGKTIHEATRRLFQGALLLQIEREGWSGSPHPSGVVHAGDRLAFAGSVEQIAALHSVEGLRSTADPHFEVSEDAPTLSEVVIAPTSDLVGKTLRRTNFRSQYGSTVLALYRQGKRVEGVVADAVLRPGDTLMLLGEQPRFKQLYFGNDFYVIEAGEELPLFRPVRATISIVALLFMVVAAALGVSMLIASVSAALAVLLSGAIRPRQALGSIEWNLLLLIGSAFAIGRGLVASGVADTLASLLLAVTGSDPTFIVAGLFLLTLIVTEVVTNNAAALIIFPIAVEVMKLAGYASATSLKAAAVTVALAASYSFLTPIGYQTNTIVYGPGGYRFTDYVRAGLPLTLLVWAVATYLVPIVWPIG